MLSAMREASMTLRDVAAKREIVYGSSLGTGVIKDQPFAALFARQCGFAVPEHMLTWVALRPRLRRTILVEVIRLNSSLRHAIC